MERRRRLHPPLPPGARGARLGGAVCSTRVAATATARTSTGRLSRTGARRTRGTSSSRSTRLVAEGLADSERLAVTGYSYGGYMTCYLTSRDERFAAAVAGGVVSDLVSMGGTSDDAHLLARYELGGESWAIGDRYQAMSPLSRVERVVTPTLVYHGEEDREMSGRPGAAVVHGITRARRADDARPLPGRRAPVHPRRSAVAPPRLQPPRHGLGGAACRRRGHAPATAARRRALAPPPGRPGRTPQGPGRDARHPPRRRGWCGRDLRGRLRPAQQGDRGRDDRGLRLPDRLDDEGLDERRS